MPPSGEIARSVTDDAVRGQCVAHELDASSHVEREIVRHGGGPFLPLCIGLRSSVEIDGLTVVPQGCAFGEFIHLRTDCEIGGIYPVKFFRVGMDVDQRAVLSLQRRDGISIGRRLPQPGTHCQHEVGIFHTLDQLGIGAIAKRAGIDAAGRRDRVLPAESGGNWNAEPFGEKLEMFAGLRIPSSAADNCNGRGCVGDERHHRLHGVGTRCLRRTFDPLARRSLRVMAEHVFGQGEHDRSGAARDRGGVGARDIFRNTVSAVDPCRPFGNRPKERCKVDFLETFTVSHAGIDITHEHDHRLRILLRHMDADAGVGRTGTARDESHPRPTRHCAVGTRHHRDAAFLAAGDEINRVLLPQRVEHLQEAFAGNGENPFASLLDKAVDEELRSGGRGA